MSEAQMRQQVVRILKKAGLDPVSVENSAHPGTPDVCCVGAWIELKVLSGWPKRATTPVRLPHLTNQQKVWAFRRWRAGGRVFLLLQVGRDRLLFRGDHVKDLGKQTKDELFDLAIKTWSGPPKDLAEWI